MLAILFIARTAVGFQFQSVAALGPVMVTELSIDYATLGTLVGLYMLPGVLLAVPGGVLGQRFGDKRVSLIGVGLMILGGLMVAARATSWTVGLGRAVSGTGAVLLNILLAKMVTDWFARREIGQRLFAQSLDGKVQRERPSVIARLSRARDRECHDFPARPFR